MRCPKCGYLRQTRDNAFVPATECPACGVVYSKHETSAPAGPTRVATPTPPNLRPSPVDQDSLKKARDRVEKRLRKRLENKVTDERHAQTLKLARQFTEEEMRKRQSQNEETQGASNDEPDQNPPIQASSAEAADTPAPAAAPDAPKAELDAAPASEAEKAPSEMVDAALFDEITPDAAFGMQDEGSDVYTETIILTSPRPEGDVEQTPPDFDSTPLEAVPPARDASQPESEPAATDQASATAKTINVASLSAISGLSQRSNGLVRMLTAVAWLILGAGVIGAILSWTTISNVEAGMRIPVNDSIRGLPLGLLLGFAYLATGALGFAFFWVSSIISRQLKDIRRLLMLQPGVMAAAEGVAEFSEDIENREQLEN